MADSPRSPETEDAGPGPDGSEAKSTPRWVLILVAAAVIAVVGLMVFLHVNGALGPGVH